MALCYQVQGRAARGSEVRPGRSIRVDEELCGHFPQHITSSVNKPIHVLHLLGTAQREGIGVAKIVAELAKGLSPKYKLQVWFLQSDGPLIDELCRDGIDARWIDWAEGLRDPLGALRFWRQLRAEDFALVHQHWGARLIRRLVHAGSHAKIIVHSHGRLFEKHHDTIAAEGADALIAVSESVAHQMPGKQVRVVYSGIAASMERTRLTRGNSVVIGTACRLIEAKGVRELILAFAGLKKEFPSVRLEIAGSGPEEQRLAETARELGVADGVKFLGWVDDLRQVLRTWDVFALPSYDEGLPMSILEAMAEGLPVVATNVGGIPELVEDGRTGYLVPPGDVGALRTVLHRLVEDSQSRNQLGDQGRLRAGAKFSVEQMVTEIESIYDGLIADR